MSGLDFEFEPTQRGFQRADFKDLYGHDCSIQASSLATDNAIWLGCNHETTHEPTKHPRGARMHLNRGQVASLIPILQHFVNTGELAAVTGHSAARNPDPPADGAAIVQRNV